MRSDRPWSDRSFAREVENAVEAGRGHQDAVRRPMNIALHPTWRKMVLLRTVGGSRGLNGI